MLEIDLQRAIGPQLQALGAIGEVVGPQFFTAGSFSTIGSARKSSQA
jgi:hypothetical protein